MPGDETTRIVLVDPSGRLEDRLGDALVASGFDVRTIDSATACLRLVERDGVDGVVSAHALPDLDGIKLLRSLRVSYPTFPFLLMPDEGSDAIASDAVAADVSGYFPPDTDVETVVAHLHDRLERDRPWVNTEAQERYRHLVEMSPAPINLFDATGESIWCNDAVVDLLGLDDRDELIGHSIFEFVHPDDSDLVREELEDVVANQKSVGPTRMKLQRPDGSIRHVQIATATGRFLGENVGQAVIVDITPVHEARAELREEQRFVAESLDALQDVFYVVDAAGDLQRWNETVSDVTGYDDEALTELNVTALFEASDADRILASVETTLAEGTDAIEANLVADAGRSIPYEFRSHRLSGRDDGGPRVVVIGRDVSEREERKRQLEVLEQWLRHNIRNEMNVVRGIAENVRLERVDDPASALRRLEAHTDHIVEQADRERRVVELLTEPPDPVPIDVRNLVEREVALCRERYPSATVEVVCADDVSVSAVPDLRRAVRELLENAVENNDADTPTVTVEVAATDGHGTIRVRDDGPGIPDIEWETLLRDREIDQLHHSSGLGLLFVYWVSRLSDGDLSITTNDPRGSTVTLTLPVSDA